MKKTKKYRARAAMSGRRSIWTITRLAATLADAQRETRRLLVDGRCHGAATQRLVDGRWTWVPRLEGSTRDLFAAGERLDNLAIDRIRYAVTSRQLDRATQRQERDDLARQIRANRGQCAAIVAEFFIQ